MLSSLPVVHRDVSQVSQVSQVSSSRECRRHHRNHHRRNHRPVTGGIRAIGPLCGWYQCRGAKKKSGVSVRAAGSSEVAVGGQPVTPDPVSPTTGKKTKVTATIGPTSSDPAVFNSLADAGMNVCRLNMSHGTHESHMEVVRLVRAYNATALADNRPTLAILLDTKGPEVRSGDVSTALLLQTGDTFTYTIDPSRVQLSAAPYTVSINYDGFLDDVAMGDRVLVDGGILSMDVVDVDSSSVACRVVDGGEMGSRRHINVRGKSANLPAITEKDWADIKWGIYEAQVDYFALSFVRDATVIHELRAYLVEEAKQKNESTRIGILAKIESADSTKHLEEILDAVDGAMVARGDLGAELPVEEVPFWQDSIVKGCRVRGKPCIVATNMLESMITHPLATRAEVTDISVAVREGTDAVMLSGETAYGSYPLKSVQTMSEVCRETEKGMMAGTGAEEYGSERVQNVAWSEDRHDHYSDVIAFHAAQMSDTLACSLVVFSRRGNLPKLLSRVRPNANIYCFTDNEVVQRRLALYHGVHAFALKFEGRDSEQAFADASQLLLDKGYVHKGDPVVVVRGGTEPIWRPKSPYACQIRMVEQQQ